MTNPKNERFFVVDGKPIEYKDYSDIDPEFPCELVSPLYEKVDVKAKTPEALRAAVRTAVEAVEKAEEEGSSEKADSIALRVAAQQKDVRVQLCVVFKS